MSDLATDPRETECGAEAVDGPVRERYAGVAVALGGPRAMAVHRTLPNRTRRMVGAWCFLDHYGPQDVATSAGMRVPPHPHTGLQTVSWLLAGEVLHRDSLGSLQTIVPGALNLMTAGRGISHSEESPKDRTPTLHGVQLWVALPGEHRDITPAFEHHADLPALRGGGATATVFLGELGDARSPAKAYSPIVGAEVVLEAGAEVRLPLCPGWEHAVLVLEGSDASVDGEPLERGPLLYLGTGRTELPLAAGGPVRLLLLGGEPFGERIVMWWNFVGPDHTSVVAAREQWNAGDPRFGEVHGYAGDRLRAPTLPSVRLRSRGRTG
jgi:redox-sensitive bicupin YhaK (pirin superfamily)